MSKTRDPEIRDEVRSFALYVHCRKRYRDRVVSFNTPHIDIGVKREGEKK
jgi:hypothetical protein